MIIVVTGLVYWGLDQLKPSTTVSGDSFQSVESSEVKEIKGLIKDYKNWETENYNRIKAKIDLMANMKNLTISEKVSLNTLLENQNAHNIKAKFKSDYKNCKLTKALNIEVDKLYKNPKYRDFIKYEHTTKRKYYYIKNNLVKSINQFSKRKYDEKKFNGLTKKVRNYFSANVKKCKKTKLIESELNEKLDKFKSAHFSYEMINPSNNTNDWRLIEDTINNINYYYSSSFNNRNRFKQFDDFDWYVDKLKSYNIKLYDNSILYK